MLSWPYADQEMGTRPTQGAAFRSILQQLRMLPNAGNNSMACCLRFGEGKGGVVLEDPWPDTPTSNLVWPGGHSHGTLCSGARPAHVCRLALFAPTEGSYAFCQLLTAPVAEFL